LKSNRSAECGLIIWSAFAFSVFLTSLLTFSIFQFFHQPLESRHLPPSDDHLVVLKQIPISRMTEENIFFPNDTPEQMKVHWLIPIFPQSFILFGSVHQLQTKKFSRQQQEYYIVSAINQNMVLDINAASKSLGAQLILCEFHGGPNQRWTFEDGGTIRSVNSGLVLDVSGGSAVGNKIIQYEKHGGQNQKWSVHGDGTIRVDGLALDIREGNVRNGEILIAWFVHGGPNQQWKIIPARP